MGTRPKKCGRNLWRRLILQLVMPKAAAFALQNDGALTLAASAKIDSYFNSGADP
ncbi:MAG: hypothetical protein JKX88_06335 [Marinicaulis sp.]|nr:hypothetical protein [Marinicaulis sp.]